MNSKQPHRTTISTAALAICAAATLAISGCGTGDKANTASSNTQTSTETKTETTGNDPDGSAQSESGSENSGSFYEGDGSQASPSGQQSEPKSGGGSGNQDVGKQVMDQLAGGLKVGDKLQIGSVSTTACVVGDGYGTHVWAAGPNTSCEFAKNVGDELTKSLNPTQEDVRKTLPSTVKATSPETKQSYDMTCTADGSKVITCRGGNDASVYLY